MPNTSSQTLLLPKYLLPVAPDNTVLENFGIAVEEEKIIEIDSHPKLIKKYPTAPVVSLSDHVLMPGLVNAHSHLAMSLLRGIGNSLPLERWLSEVIWPLETKFAAPNFVSNGSDLAIAEMIANGITTASDMYFHPQYTAHQSVSAGFRLQVAFPIFERTTSYAQSAADCIHKGLELCDQFRSVSTIHMAFGPHSPYTVSAQTFEKILTLSSEMNLPIQTHLHETKKEVLDAKERLGKSWIEHFDNQGLLIPELQAVHMTALSPSEVELIGERGISVIHCPRSNMKLASGRCPVLRLRERGIRVGIGTDGAASNNDLDILGESRLAGLLAKDAEESASVLPAHDLLEMATIGGAEALGIEDQIGSIEAGKYADVIAIDTHTPSLQPIHDLQSQLIDTQAANHVTHVWIAGKPIYAEKQYLTLDIDQTIEEAIAWQRKLSQ